MQEAEAAFDQYAIAYDDAFTFSSIGKLQRARVWKFLSENISPVTHPDVLELNCGTGEDAAWFTRKGYHITATDISNEMVKLAQEKIGKAKAELIQSDITDIGNKLFNKKFDLIFSDFGGMNCLSPVALRDMSSIFSRLLKPGGKMILVIMSRNCSWEQRYFKRKNDPENAFRRRSKEGVEAIIFDKKFSTWYYSPGEIVDVFSSSFNLRKFKPIGYAIPPSYLEPYFRKRPLFLKMLSLGEKVFGNFSSLADKADHFIIELERK
jgi:ubiquinone/menaquinone biosynthesis C-methylase UbiE